MEIFRRIASKFRKKTMTADQWKKGIIQSDFSLDKGVQLPYKDSALVFVAVSKIAENLASVPLEFINKQTKQVLSDETPLVRLFNKPNEYQSYFTFFEELTMFLSLYGETFIWLGESMGQRIGTSTIPGQVTTLNPTRMQDVWDSGEFVGWIYDTGNRRIALTKDEVLQVKFPNPYNPVRGFAPIDSAIYDVNTDFLASRFSKAFFQNSANPSLVFTTPEDDESSDEQRKSFLKEWNMLRQGASKQYKAAVLNPGMGIVKTGLTQEEMDYIKQRKFSEERILSVYGVPPAMAGYYEQATYGNVRTAKKIFWNETIKSYAKRYESAINYFLLPDVMPNVKCKFNFSDIDELKHDMKETAELVNIYANHGVPMNVLNEAFELPWSSDLEGLDIGYQPMTSLPVGTNFIQEQRDMSNDNEKAVDTKPNIFNSLDPNERIAHKYYAKKIDEVEANRFKNEFSKMLHNYLFGQRKKILKRLDKDPFSINKDFWKQENDRLMTKFEEIYSKLNDKYNKSRKTQELVKINNFNQKLLRNIKIDDQTADKVRDLYNKFDKAFGDLDDSRVNLLADDLVCGFLEQTNNRRS